MVHLYLIYSQALHNLNKQVPKKWGEKTPTARDVCCWLRAAQSFLGGFRDGTANSELWI